MTKLIISDGGAHDPSWAHSVVICQDYTGDVTLNPSAAVAAGGQLLNNTPYYYKVVALMKEWIVDSVSPSPMSAWVINAPHGFVAHWELNNSGTTRRATLYSDINHTYKLATGTRTNDGSITLVEQNGSGISGSVTVTYTADASGTLTYTCDAVLGFDEVTATPLATDLSVKIDWDAPQGVLEEYRVYCGLTTGIYDYFYTVATNTLTDTGLLTKKYDEMWHKKRIANLSTLFIPATTCNGTVKEAKSVLQIIQDFGSRYPFEYDLTQVTNQATWNLGTAAATHQAQVDINSWL